MYLTRISFRTGQRIAARRTGHAGPGIFSSCRLERLPQDWHLHATRLQIPTRLQARILQTIQQCKTTRQYRHARVRIVRDQVDSIVVSFQFLRHPPARFVLDPLEGTWPAYRQKHSDRSAFQRGRPLYKGSERYERLLVDAATGYIIETDTANILVHLNGRWCTPDWQNTPPGLAGTERWKQRTHLQLVFRPIHRDDLLRADALAVCNAVVGVRQAILRQDAH